MTEYGEIARCTICGGEPTIRIRHSGAYIKCKTCGNGFEVVRNDFENPRNKEQELYGVWNAKQDANRRFLEMNAESVAPIDTSIHDHLEKSNKEIVASILKATEELADAFTEKYNALAEQLSSLSRQIAEKPIGKMSDILKSGIEVSFAQFGTTLDDKLKAMENNIIDAVDCGTDSVCNAIEGRPAECMPEPAPSEDGADAPVVGQWAAEADSVVEPEPAAEPEPQPAEPEEAEERGIVSNPEPVGADIKSVADALKARAAEEGMSIEELEDAVRALVPDEPQPAPEPAEAVSETEPAEDAPAEVSVEVVAEQAPVGDVEEGTVTIPVEPQPAPEPVGAAAEQAPAEPEPAEKPEPADDAKRMLVDATAGMSYDELTAYLQDFLASRKN